GLVERLYAKFTARRPGRAEILGEHGQAIVRRQIERFVADALDAGIDPVDVPDHFYLWRRMGTWAGPTHGAVEYVRDTTSPLWSARMLPHALGLPAAERAREEFHLKLLEHLAPKLVDLPFEKGQTWPSRQTELQRRAKSAT